MKNLLLTLVTISILSCTKKQDDPKPVVTTTQKQSNPVSNCNKDSSWTRTHPNIKGSLYTFHETCTTITISFKITGQTITLTKPTDATLLSNYSSLSFYNSDANPKKIYYRIYYAPNNHSIIYDVNEAGSMGVGGAGMKIN